MSEQQRAELAEPAAARSTSPRTAQWSTPSTAPSSTAPAGGAAATASGRPGVQPGRRRSSSHPAGRRPSSAPWRRDHCSREPRRVRAGPPTGRRCPRDSVGVSMVKLPAVALAPGGDGSRRDRIGGHAKLTFPRPRSCDSSTPRSPTTTPVNRAGASIDAAAARDLVDRHRGQIDRVIAQPGLVQPDPGQHRQRRGQTGLGGQRGGQGAEGVVPGRLDLRRRSAAAG